MRDDTPMTLDEAASTLLRGLVKASTLRAAIAAGTLSHERQGRRIIVTKRDIEEWRSNCRVAAQKALACGSSQSGELPPEPKTPSGASSTMEESNAALAALRANVAKLKTSSPPTSPRRGRQNASATVHQLR